MNCPICGGKQVLYFAELNTDKSREIVEYSADCTVCDYSYLESYGKTLVSFGDNYWVFGIDTPSQELIEIQQEITQKLSQAKPSFIYSKYRYYEVDNDPIPF